MQDSKRYPGLDFLRCMAIVSVMVFHSFLVGGLGERWTWLSHDGWMGVDLFFVLSGFLIGTQVLTPLASGGRLSFSDFYLRRAFRILPAYWATLMVYWCWPSFREADGLEPAWKFLTFTMNFTIDYGTNAAFSHAWSLCVEEHFYWLFPVAAVALSYRPNKWKFIGLCSMIVFGGIGLRAAIWLHDARIDPDLDRNWFIEDIYYPTWNRLDGLLCGVVLAVWKSMNPHSWDRARRYSNAALLMGLLGLAASFWLFRVRVGLLANSIGWPVLSMSLASLVFAGAGRDGWLGRINGAFWSWMAAISYSLYLVHKPVYHLVQSHFGPMLEGRGVLAFLAYGGAAVLAGALLHYSIERPFLKLRDRCRPAT